MKYRMEPVLSVVLRIFSRAAVILILAGSFSFQGSNEAILFAQSFRERPAVKSVTPQMPEVQRKYPAFAKIIGHDEARINRQNQSQAVFYGSGVYVAEQGHYGIVVTNWHVVADSEESIQVKFPSFETPGVVILADDVWDLAAIVIRKPPFLPVPISLEVPQIHEELWVGGYGQYPGLNGFQMQSAHVSRYMVLGTKQDLPAETLALDVGVRQGDSGGPILNRYGELAGLLWGSDGTVTMGTFSLRLQAFLTQAQFQLFNQPATTKDFFARSMKQYPPKKIQMAATPAQSALQACGIFPISSQPVYRKSGASATDSKANGSAIPYTSAEDKFRAMPPYPPIESPTLIAQRGVIGREHPEVYPQDRLKTEQSRQQPTNHDRITSPSTTTPQWQEVSLTTGEGKAVSGSATQLPEEKTPEEPASSSKTVTSSAETPSDGSGLQFQLGDVRIIFVVFILFFLFFNAVRLLAIAGEK